MKPSGWIFMLVSWGVILGLFVYCMVRTLRSGQHDSERDVSEPPADSGRDASGGTSGQHA